MSRTNREPVGGYLTKSEHDVLIGRFARGEITYDEYEKVIQDATLEKLLQRAGLNKQPDEVD